MVVMAIMITVTVVTVWSTPNNHDCCSGMSRKKGGDAEHRNHEQTGDMNFHRENLDATDID